MLKQLRCPRRDLKPENFLLESPADDSPLKACDFGLSKFFRPGEVLTNLVGSPFYIAPEVWLPPHLHMQSYSGRPRSPGEDI